MTQVISREVAAQMVREYNGSTFFSVKFVKRTDGSVRDMVCRKGVSKFVKGGELKFDPKAKNLVGVWEANTENPDKAYRMINLESLLEIKMNGNVFVVRS